MRTWAWVLFASGAAAAVVAVATPALWHLGTAALWHLGTAALWHLGTAALLEVLGAVMWANREDE